MINYGGLQGYHGWTLLFYEQYNIVEATMVAETGENNIERTSLFAIVIIVAQPCE